jgi:hypothetical protein
MIKYQYAYNATRKIVKIDQVNDKKEKYRCINCNNELIPKIGKIKVHHFAHKTLVDCNSETYLHKLGKSLFEQEFNYCKEKKISFYIELNQQKYCNCSDAIYQDNCYIGEELVKYDLTKHYRKINLEQKLDDFKPDILLRHSDEKDHIFIEIAVTHNSSEEKLNSNYRIIELSVEKESDLDCVSKHLLSESNHLIKFHNFKVKDININNSVSECDKEVEIFVVYKSGKCNVKKTSLNRVQSEINLLKPTSLYLSTEKLSFEKHVVDAYKKSHITKNCYLCVHHKIANPSFDILDYFENVGKPIYCFKNKIRCNCNVGIDCDHFHLSQRKINEYLT